MLHLRIPTDGILWSAGAAGHDILWRGQSLVILCKRDREKTGKTIKKRKKCLLFRLGGGITIVSICQHGRFMPFWRKYPGGNAKSALHNFVNSKPLHGETQKADLSFRASRVGAAAMLGAAARRDT
jgi:hypothetical protein